MSFVHCAAWAGRRLAVVLLVASLGGCGFVAGAAVGGAGVAWIKGEASKSYSRPVAEVYAAALEVLEGMHVVTTEKLSGDQVAIIKGRTAGGQDVSMRIERQAKGVSLVRLRIGLVGDKDYSTLIFEGLDEKLGG